MPDARARRASLPRSAKRIAYRSQSPSQAIMRATHFAVSIALPPDAHQYVGTVAPGGQGAGLNAPERRVALHPGIDLGCQSDQRGPDAAQERSTRRGLPAEDEGPASAELGEERGESRHGAGAEHDPGRPVGDIEGMHGRRRARSIVIGRSTSSRDEPRGAPGATSSGRVAPWPRPSLSPWRNGAPR
jgi:hypothetical protein